MLRVLLLALFVAVNVYAEMPPGVYAYQEQVKVLGDEPRLFFIEKFLTDEECDYLIERARPALERSTVVSESLEKGQVGTLHDARTSRGMFLERYSKDPILKEIEKKIVALTGIPEKKGEAIQILSYGYGAEYRPHFDYFDPSSPGGSACYHRGGQRVATVFMYLADTEEGGETVFPEIDVSVRPVKGNALLLYNCTPDGVEDPLSLHGSAPVVSGEKWVAVKWLRSGTFH